MRGSSGSPTAGSADALDVLLVEPYHGGSHREWAEGYARHSRHRVRLVTHDGSFWRWRMRGGSLTLGDMVASEVAANGRPDVVLVSGMIDLPALLGFCRDSLAGVPVGLYLHENQLLYPPAPPRAGRPDRAAEVRDEFGTRNWLSMVVADAVFVNSRYHRVALLGAVDRIVRRAPDHSHESWLLSVEAKTTVLPVGVELRDLLAAPRCSDAGAPLVVWNQRWEHDKRPDVLLDALTEAADEGVAFRLALAGENVRVDPREFETARRHLGDRVVHVGFLPREDYAHLMLRSDVMVSSAEHEFFGVAAVEAMAAGVVPLLPNRLSYPDIVPAAFHDAVLYEDEELTPRLRQVLYDLEAARHRIDGLRLAMAQHAWPEVAGAYDAAMAGLASRNA